MFSLFALTTSSRGSAVRLGAQTAMMARSARVVALGLSLLASHAMGHMNSEVNLARSRRLHSESVNEKWQCEENEVCADGCLQCSSVTCRTEASAHVDGFRGLRTDAWAGW